MMNLITVESLTAFYESKKVFNNLSFTVEDGDYLCITGENGSGKTTLMKILLDLDIKHKGTVKLNGFTKREIGYLPQKTRHQTDFPASVKEVVLSGFAGGGFLGARYSKLQKQQAADNMELLGIKNIAEKSFSELSGGQQQKVLLCRALCAAKRVLLLDEPTTSLDKTATEEMYEIIEKLNKNGLAVIMITHDMVHAANCAKHVLSFSEDNVFFGTKLEYKNCVVGEI